MSEYGLNPGVFGSTSYPFWKRYSSCLLTQFVGLEMELESQPSQKMADETEIFEVWMVADFHHVFDFFFKLGAIGTKKLLQTYLSRS